MKVKIISDFNYGELEADINEFLKSFTGEIIDIKFAAFSDDSESLNHNYATLIMYNPK